MAKAPRNPRGEVILAVHVANGTFTVREIEREVERCSHCGAKPATLFSYDDTGEGLCNKGHWVGWVVRGRQSPAWKRKVYKHASEQGKLKAKKSKVTSITDAPSRRRQKAVA